MTFFMTTERNCHQVDSNRNVHSCSLSVALVQPSEPKLVREVLSLFSPKHKSHTNVILLLPNCERKLTVHYWELEYYQRRYQENIFSPPTQVLLFIFNLTSFSQKGISLNIKNIPKHLIYTTSFSHKFVVWCLGFFLNNNKKKKQNNSFEAHTT